MIHIRQSFAILTARVFSRVCRLLGKQGVTMAGKLAMKIDPSILKDLEEIVLNYIQKTYSSYL